MSKSAVPTKPFLPDAPASTPTGDPIADGITRLRQQHRDNVTKYASDFDLEATRAWEAAEAKRRSAFLKDYRDRNWFPPKYPYATLDREGQFRVSLPYDFRIEGLAAVGLFGEMLRCLLARTPGHKAPVAHVKGWMRSYLDVDGPMMIISTRGSHDRAYVAEATTSTNDLIHAKQLSLAFAKLITNTSMITTEFGQVSWFAPESFEESEY